MHQELEFAYHSTYSNDFRLVDALQFYTDKIATRGSRSPAPLFPTLFEKFFLPLLEKQRGEEFDNAYYDDPAVDDEVTCTALQNYYSELPEDLLFLQGDEIKIEKKLGGGFYLVKIAWMFPALHR